MKGQGRFFKSVKVSISFVLLTVAVFCVLRRLPECFGSQNPAALAAAAFTLTDGEYRLEASSKSNDASIQPTDDVDVNVKTEDAKKTEPKLRDKSGYYDSYADHSGEAVYEVAENRYTGEGLSVDNFYIKNNTGLSLDFNALLKDKLTFDVKKNTKSPQVLIYHTHSSEAYMDEDVDYFYESYYSRTQNEDFNVVGVGETIAKQLNSKGIKTLHDKTIHDSTYNGAYDRSAQSVLSNMDEYKDIKVVLDIHRDAIGTSERKIKPVFEYNGKKGAQIMIMSGCDTTGERNFLSWENNLNFALKLQSTAEKLYPGMTRPLNFGFFAYNEYVCDGSLLIEVGTEANSIEEAEYTGKLLGNVLCEVLK